VVKNYVNREIPITFVEFEVYEGKSIIYFTSQNDNSKSIFVGLDSFEGLPEDWGSMKKGTFSTNGVVPNKNDLRIKFVKG